MVQARAYLFEDGFMTTDTDIAGAHFQDLLWYSTSVEKVDGVFEVKVNRGWFQGKYYDEKGFFGTFYSDNGEVYEIKNGDAIKEKRVIKIV